MIRKNINHVLENCSKFLISVRGLRKLTDCPALKVAYCLNVNTIVSVKMSQC